MRRLRRWRLAAAAGAFALLFAAFVVCGAEIADWLTPPPAGVMDR